MLVLVLAPWILQGAWRAWSADRTAPQPGDVSNGNDRVRPTGPWGRLSWMPIVISPPREYVPQHWTPVTRPVWFFPVTGTAALRDRLASAGLSPNEVTTLVSSAQSLGSSSGFRIPVDPQWVLGLSADLRARLYHDLEQDPRNEAQAAAARYFGSSVQEWLGPVAISPETRRLVDPLIYRYGEFLYFADLDLIRDRIPDPAELGRLAKGLLRQATLVASLHVSDADSLDAIVEYWGRGGRRTDIRPLLESVAGGDGDRAIDISHLLPTLAREHLYRYPQITEADLDRPLLANCLWTALNFFNREPDDRYLDVRQALETLRQDYYVVQDGFQLGDVVVFLDEHGQVFHTAVYVADGVVFGKNGSMPLDPWSLLPLDRIKGHYSQYSDRWSITYRRLRGL